MNQSWGHYDDPDTLQGLAQYEASGLTLRTPSDIQHLGSSDLRSVAYACSALLDSTYKGNYPQSTKDVDALAASIAMGDTLLFMLLDVEALTDNPEATMAKTRLTYDYWKNIERRPEQELFVDHSRMNILVELAYVA